MKVRLFVTVCLLFSVVLSSCSGDNLYEFEELSKKADFVFEVSALPKNKEEFMTFSANFYETDGYGDVIYFSYNYTGKELLFVVNNGVKEYKNVGVKFVPERNVGSFQIRIYRLENGSEYFVQRFDNPDGEVIINYDFEIHEASVE